MENSQSCPCCNNCKDCPGFQKVVNVKNAGLVIYRYSTCRQNENSNEGEMKSSRDVIILHNTKNHDIASNNITPEFGLYKKCPRCKYILENAEKLLFKVSTINKLAVLGICDKCQLKDRVGVSCECSGVVNKFIALQNHKKRKYEDEKQKKFHLHKLIKHVIFNDEHYKKPRDRSKSESYIDNLGRADLKQVREPEVGQLFERELRYGSDQIEKQQGRIRFSNKAEKIDFTRKQHSDSELVNVDFKIIHSDRSSIHHSAENIISIKHDFDTTYIKDIKKKSTYYPVRRISSQESFDVKTLRSFHEMSKQREKYFESYVQKPHISTQREERFLQIDKDEKSSWELEPKQDRKRKKYYIKEESYEFNKKISAKIPVKSSSEILNFGARISNARLDALPSPLPTRKYHSEENIIPSVLAEKQDPLRKDFSYFFIKESEIKKPVPKRKSSSELIKETQDMLRAREEESKKKRELELKQKLEDEDKKRLARERTKSLLDEEKKKKSLKDRKILETDKEKKEIQKVDKGDKTPILKEKTGKDTRTPSEKSKKSAASKIDKTEEKEAKRAQKEKEKQEKQEKLKLEKERKLKEKEEKERLKKEKEEQLQRAKEEKERLKKEKEEQAKKDKEGNAKRKKEEQSIKEKEIPKMQKEKPLKENQQQKADDIPKKEEPRDGKEKMKASADKKGKEEAELKLKRLQEMDTKPEKQKSQLKLEEPKIKELNINQIKVRKPSPDDLILQLVKLKQSDPDKPRERPKRLSEIAIPIKAITEHKEEHKNQKLSTCVICNDSDLELDIDEIILKKAETLDVADIIIGQKVFKCKTPFIQKLEEKQTAPVLFSSTFKDDVANVPDKTIVEDTPVQLERKPLPLLTGKYTEQEIPKGVIRYALSDRTFIDKGWTMLPTEKVVRKMNIYRMRPAHPEFDWFEHNKNKKIIYYDSGERLAEFDDNGRGRWYYRSGRLALDYYDAEEINAQQRFVVHSSGEPDERGRSRPLAILATFDYLGNGIVFDHAGKIRLKYNQTEGVVLDRSIGPVSHWKWHTLNDPPVLQQVMIDTQMAHKDPDILKLGGPADSKTRPDNEEMLAIEFDNFIKEKSKKLSQQFKPFQIKMKALKINEHFSLKVLDQATIYLIYRDGSTNLKLNIGMILDHQEIVDTDTAEVGEVSNSLSRFPAKTDSLAGLQRSVAYAQRVERARVEREHRLRPTQPCSSSDKLTAAIARPLRTPLRTVPSESTVAAGECRCKCRKPPANSLYYDTRLV